MTTGLPVKLVILYGHRFVHPFIDILLVQRQIIRKCLHRGPSPAVTSLIGPFVIVPGHEGIEIGLDLV